MSGALHWDNLRKDSKGFGHLTAMLPVLNRDHVNQSGEWDRPCHHKKGPTVMGSQIHVE